MQSEHVFQTAPVSMPDVRWLGDSLVRGISAAAVYLLPEDSSGAENPLAESAVAGTVKSILWIGISIVFAMLIASLG